MSMQTTASVGFKVAAPITSAAAGVDCLGCGAANRAGVSYGCSERRTFSQQLARFQLQDAAGLLEDVLGIRSLWTLRGLKHENLATVLERLHVGFGPGYAAAFGMLHAEAEAEAKDCPNSCLGMLHAEAEASSCGAHRSAHGSVHETSDVLPDNPDGVLPSPAVMHALRCAGVGDLRGLLCGPLGVRSLRVLADMPEGLFADSCARIKAAGFGPGHLAALAQLRADLASKGSAAHVKLDVACVGQPMQVMAVNPANIDDALASAEESWLLAPSAELAAVHAEPATQSNFEHLLGADETPASTEDALRPAPWARGHLHQLRLSATLNTAIAEMDQATLGVQHVGFAQVRHDLYCISQEPATISNVSLAIALDQFDRVVSSVAEEARSHIKKSLWRVQDALVLAITREVDPSDKRAFHGACRQAFGRSLEGEEMLSRLGNSKFQLFNRGCDGPWRAEGRPTRRRARGRTQCGGAFAEQSVGNASSAAQPSLGSVGNAFAPIVENNQQPDEMLTFSPCSNDGVEHEVAPKFTRVGTPAFGQPADFSPTQGQTTTLDPDTNMHGTEIDEDPVFLAPPGLVLIEKNGFLELADEMSDLSHSRSDVTWPMKAKKVRARQSYGRVEALAPRAQVDEILQHMNAEVSLPVVDDNAKRIMNAFLDELPTMRAGSLVRDCVELFRNTGKPQLELSVNGARDLAAASRTILQQMSPHDAAQIALCCVAVGGLAVAHAELSDEVVLILVDVMKNNWENGCSEAAISEAAIAAALRIYRNQGYVLGLPVSQHVSSLKTSTHEALRSAIAPLVAEPSTSMQRDIPLILARSQSVADVVKFIGVEHAFWDLVLSEAYDGLEQELSWTWSDSDEDMSLEGDSQVNATRREHVQKIALQVTQCSLNDSCHPGLCTMVRWVQRATTSAKSSNDSVQRFQFLGLVFGARIVVRELFSSLDDGIRRGRFDEEHIATLLRAISELSEADLVEADVARSIIERIIEDTFNAKTYQCLSAFAGVLGTLFHPRLGGDSLNDLGLACRVVTIIVETANWALRQYLSSSSGLLHECVWALNAILSKNPPSNVTMLQSCEKLASDVCRNKYLQAYDCEEWVTTNDCKAIREARKLHQSVGDMVNHDDQDSVPERTDK